MAISTRLEEEADVDCRTCFAHLAGCCIEEVVEGAVDDVDDFVVVVDDNDRRVSHCC